MKTQINQKRKFLLVLPLLVLPFVTLGFWALGGGSGDQRPLQTEKAGLNTKLPDAHNSDKDMDKLSYYQQAQADSVKRREQLAFDPYAQGAGNENTPHAPDSSLPGQGFYRGDNAAAYTDPNEAKVYERLSALQKAMNQPVGPTSHYGQAPVNAVMTPGTINSSEVDRLEKMMKAMQAGNSEPDPETAQLNSMLEKILDIQHPERVAGKSATGEGTKKGAVYPVAEPDRPNRVTTLQAPKDSGRISSSPGFYGLDKDVQLGSEQNAIPAVIHQDQVIVSGATVKLRLTAPISINGVTVPKDNFVFGLAQLSGERLTIKITSITYKKSVFPVQLSVYDIDGLDGIYIPGAITRDVAKQSADQSIQGISLGTYDPSLGAQAASAGIEAAKQLISRKIKLVKVYVKAGYQVLLRDEKQKE